MRLWPLTGRRHQLRLHCAKVLRTPILGDAKYGGSHAADNWEVRPMGEAAFVLPLARC